ncbi:nuclear transport factor 2-like isoform X1 [Zingiber officinale]|uniref:nuclear transport factor 2-like isoform X1 n=1 Tax=Zingiber officinale TaxID=94328 RepID=UPI001C4B7764|nr:nuclear transport factor 2-like isoform X1 [Zingiber officinale]
MASVYPAHVDAVQVGAFFLKNYYPILQQQPELVHQFYTELSSMVRFDGTATESATGMVQIHHLVMCLNFKGIEIKSAHSLESWNGGVLVMVSGYVELEDYSSRRKFVQTFFLAPQEEGYFVLNDIFHFLEEEHIHQHPAALMPQGEFETDMKESSPASETVSVRDYTPGEVQAQDMAPPIHVEENATAEKYNTVEAPQQLSVSDERLDEPPQDSASYPVALETMREPSPPTAPEEPAGEPTKHTYASILLAKGQSGLPTHQLAVAKGSQITSERAHSTQPIPQQPQPAIISEKSGSESIEEVLLVEDEGDIKSVYVGNLPSSISISDLQQVFKHFGKLRPDGVSIRSRKESDVFYAFIEYEDVIGVQNALKASPVQLNGRLIHVEGRRPNSGISRGKRERGRGRGYPSEASRGRGGGRIFSRGSRPQDSERDYTSRSRGNGYPQRVQDTGY